MPKSKYPLEARNRIECKWRLFQICKKADCSIIGVWGIDPARALVLKALLVYLKPSRMLDLSCAFSLQQLGKKSS